MEKWEMYNYADDNSVPSCHIHDVLSCLCRDYKNVVKGCRDSGMQANLSKFQFIISHSPVNTRNTMLQIDDNIALKPESRVEV